MKKFLSTLSLVALPLCTALLPACGGSDPAEGPAGGIQNPGASGTGGEDGASGGGNDDGGIRFDAGGNGTGGEGNGDPDGDDEDCDESDLPTPTAQVRGTVFAPNLELPISGALVYLTTGDPEPVPDEVYCAECVELPCDVHFVLSEPDGSFNLPAVAGPNQKLVVQKGQYLHITPVEVAVGDVQVPAEKSNLPGRWDPQNGQYIPRMAVMSSYNDTIFNVLAKIGMGNTDTSGEWDQQSAGFDVYDVYEPENGGGALLDDLDAMRAYHIIFIPCMSQSGLGQTLSPQRIENIRTWVEEGGKWYVTDWANEYLVDPFPTYQEFHESTGAIDIGEYSATGTVLDEGLLAWLSALPPGLKDIGNGFPTLGNLPSVDLHDNWSGLESLAEIIVQDEEGNDVDVGHYAWVEGPCSACTTAPQQVRPMTLSAGYGCGRMMFSTYHTNDGAHAGLSPQELVLFYIILEIGICRGDPPPPPPPIG